MGHDEMPRATTEFGDVDHAVAELKAATEEFLKAWSAVPEGGLEKTLADGKLTPLGLATIVNRHIHYHDAQLNYVQTLLGDSEIHW